MPQIIIVVNKQNELIDCGEPNNFLLWKIRDYLEQGHIIRQTTQEQFDLSGLNKKQ
jgi:hypothetical protein